ncbi:MAG TPA: hypothetical protein EYG79_07125, partial [Rhodobacteraceae bacterium]|nr:hypothetical protein [Paracoccaceae bacterium]
MEDKKTDGVVSRRQALRRIGLSTAGVYVATGMSTLSVAEAGSKLTRAEKRRRRRERRRNRRNSSGASSGASASSPSGGSSSGGSSSGCSS